MNDDMRKVLRFLGARLPASPGSRVDTPFEVDDLTFDDRVAPALSRLASAEPPYIRGITVAQANHPVVITDLTERGWETLETAGDPNNASPGAPAGTPLPTATSLQGATFQVALTFAGEQRSYVQRVAAALTNSGIKHFYDQDHQVTLWGTNQVEVLQDIYLNRSSAVVMFISKEYATKNWTNLERRSALSRAIKERGTYLLPVRFDETVLPGLDPDMSYLKISDFSPEQLAALIVEKLVSEGIAVPAKQGPQVGWAEAGRERTSAVLEVHVSDVGERPTGGAHVLAVAANGTYVADFTDDQGAVVLHLPARRLVTVLVAHHDFAPALVQDHDSAFDLNVTLPRGEGVGSTVFSAGTGDVPGLQGRLNPIRDAQDRYYLYADNISINDQAHQPHHFTPGEPLALEDAVGQRAVVTILAIIGRTSLLRFEL